MITRNDHEEARQVIAVLSSDGPLKALVEVGRQGTVSARQLEHDLGLSLGRISERMRLLVLSGLVRRDRSGPSIIYSLSRRGQAAAEAYALILASLESPRSEG